MSTFINEKLVPLKSNAGRNKLYLNYVKGSQFPVPQTIFTDSSGTEINRIVGYLGPAKFLEQMESMLTGHVN
ncbi:MAG: hypothetical protein QUS33_07880 [Dehalococcoidia bacterium]|nr:hypothetical protein [Dehalococcoidia bacterium]